MIDFIFFIDMILQFFLMKEVDTDAGTVFIKDHKTLACMYLKSWFVLDIVSIGPYDLLGCTGASVFQNLRIFRVMSHLLKRLLYRGPNSGVYNLINCLPVYREEKMFASRFLRTSKGRCKQFPEIRI